MLLPGRGRCFNNGNRARPHPAGVAGVVDLAGAGAGATGEISRGRAAGRGGELVGGWPPRRGIVCVGWPLPHDLPLVRYIT